MSPSELLVLLLLRRRRKALMEEDGRTGAQKTGASFRFPTAAQTVGCRVANQIGRGRGGGLLCVAACRRVSPG